MCFSCDFFSRSIFHMCKVTCEISHVSKILSQNSRFTCNFYRHVKFHMRNPTCETSRMIFYPWKVACEIVQVWSRMWLSFVKFNEGNLAFENSGVGVYMLLPCVKFHIWYVKCENFTSGNVKIENSTCEHVFNVEFQKWNLICWKPNKHILFHMWKITCGSNRIESPHVKTHVIFPYWIAVPQ